MCFLFRINTEFLFCNILNAVTVTLKQFNVFLQFNVSKIRIFIFFFFIYL